MKKILDEVRNTGKLELFEDLRRKIFLAQPSGVVNPSLVKDDLKMARNFANRVRGGWTYITNTEGIILANPFNLFYLKEVKKLKNLKEIIVFAPSLHNRILLKLTSFIVQPDRIIEDKTEFEALIASPH